MTTTPEQTKPAGERELLVRLFGQAREALGRGETRVRVPAGATVAEALERLARAHPELGRHLERCSFALDRSYATRDEAVGECRELAVLPPIGGG